MLSCVLPAPWGGDEDSGWSTIGRAGFIIDNLLAEKKAKPMIVVMPNGSLPRPANLPPPTPGSPPAPAFAAAMAAAQERFTNELLKDIVPYVEKNYRVLAESENRAIAGLSMGGGQTLDKIAMNKLVKLFSISVGNKDTGAHASARNLAELLDKRGIKGELHVSGGGHTWVNWRHYLNDYAQLLFR